MNFHLDKGIFPLLGMQKLPNFIGYGSKRLSPAERQVLIEEYGQHLEKFLG